MARRSIHYAWVVAAVTFVILLVTAGVRATPGVLMISLESEFAWSRAVISSAVAINIALFGLIGPFAASVMDRWGVRRVLLAAIALLAGSVALTTQMRSQWQLTLLWGVLVGTGTGVTSMVLAAIIANRWFDERRGLVLGMLSAANATGQLIFLPVLASMVAARGWRAAALVVAAAAAGVFAIVLAFMRDRPEDLGLLPTDARRTRLFGYYTLRGLSLLFLPLTLRSGASSLVIFAVFYGLDWIATVPPSVRLTSEAFGRENTGVIYGWIGASHQLGASAAAFGAGAIRTMLGDYQMAFWSAGVLCVVAGLSFLTIGRTLCPSPIPLATVATR
ncbi:MAG TPA: MFS transporter [Vicinamibacterales bacterium]